MLEQSAFVRAAFHWCDAMQPKTQPTFQLKGMDSAPVGVRRDSPSENDAVLILWRTVEIKVTGCMRTWLLVSCLHILGTCTTILFHPSEVRDFGDYFPRWVFFFVVRVFRVSAVLGCVYFLSSRRLVVSLWFTPCSHHVPSTACVGIQLARLHAVHECHR